MSSSTPLINGTDFVAIGVSDIDTSVAFYRDVLGLRESKRWGQMPAVEFETGSLTIALMQSDAFGLETKGNAHPIAFHVDDYEAARAALEERGVEFKLDTIDSGVCLQAFFDDPDGNTLGIHHRYAQGAPPAAAG
jgi:catechol 2,3-dioxygenase-like lactoylglutathione lyase family enzyme